MYLLYSIKGNHEIQCLYSKLYANDYRLTLRTGRTLILRLTSDGILANFVIELVLNPGLVVELVVGCLDLEFVVNAVV